MFAAKVVEEEKGEAEGASISSDRESLSRAALLSLLHRLVYVVYSARKTCARESGVRTPQLSAAQESKQTADDSRS